MVIKRLKLFLAISILFKHEKPSSNLSCSHIEMHDMDKNRIVVNERLNVYFVINTLLSIYLLSVSILTITRWGRLLHHLSYVDKGMEIHTD